jgi:signal transduction histidine kinase
MAATWSVAADRPPAYEAEALLAGPPPTITAVVAWLAEGDDALLRRLLAAPAWPPLLLVVPPPLAALAFDLAAGGEAAVCLTTAPPAAHLLAVRRLRQYALLLRQVAALQLLEDHRRAEAETFGHLLGHDLRSPLRIAAKFLELAAPRLPGSGEVQDYLQLAATNLRQGLRMVDALRQYARLQRLPAAEAPVALAQVVSEELAARHEACAAAGLVVSVGELPTVTGHLPQLRQAVQALLDNALQYRAAAPRLAIATRDEPDRWVVTWADNGLGLPPDALAAAFLPFHRCHPEHGEGLGMGLACVRRIAQLHGGEAWAEPVASGGTTFCLALPKPHADPRTWL